MAKLKKRKLTRFEKALPLWRAAIRKAWLRDHPSKTQDDFDELADNCADTDPGERAFHKWLDEWISREGEVIRRRLFGYRGNR
jgi:hypothetical protein